MTTPTLERRTYKGEVEVRAAEDGSGTMVAFGYAARFDSFSQNLGGFVERIDPAAFNQTIKEADVRALFNHDANMVLGRLSAGTLRLSVDEVGLPYEIDLPPNELGRSLAVSLSRRDITGSSFGMRALEDEWGETPEGFPLRTVKIAALRDVGPVTFPAYTGSESALRSLAEARHLDLHEVIAAAERNELRALITPTSVEDVAQENPSPVFRRRIRGVR